jgi:multidrug efflux pump subunit AcrA (membrane-fusion protein)
VSKVSAEATVEPPGVAGGRGGPPRRQKARWVIVAAVVLAGAGVAVAITNPFSSGEAGNPGVAQNTDATGIYTVARQNLSSQTQVAATLGYAGSYSIALPSGTSAQQVAQAQQVVAEDQLTLSADQETESAKATADSQSIVAAQTNLTTAQSTLSSDQATEAQDCAVSSTTTTPAMPATGSSDGAGSSSTAPSTMGPSSVACSQATQKVSQDQSQLTQAKQQLTSARSTATQDQDQDNVQVASDQLKLQGDQATLASEQATEVNPGTTYTAVPAVGDIISQNKLLYSLSNEPVPLLYGSIPAYRAFYVGMSDGADVGELTTDLIALGYGGGLTQSDHYSTATAAAVKRWEAALGLPSTGEVLLGQVVFEPGPIRVTSVTASVGQSTGGGGAAAASGSSDTSGSGGSSGGGGAVLTATSTTRQVSIALDASEQSEVAIGDKVTITLPNNQTTPGAIFSVGTVATTPPSSGSATSGSSSPTITVLANPTDPAATGTWDQASVTVTITTGTVANALVVPVAALRAQAGGGYAVEVVGADGVRRLVSVTLGLFDDANGLVQVTGTSLTAGQQVVVPKL